MSDDEKMPTYSFLQGKHLKKVASWYPRLFSVEEGAGNEVVSLQIINGGLANSNYKVETREGQRYLLKICNEKPLQDLLVQVAALEHFRVNGYTCCPFPFPHGAATRHPLSPASDVQCVLVVSEHDLVVHDEKLAEKIRDEKIRDEKIMDDDGNGKKELRMIVYDFLSGNPGNVANVSEKMMRELGVAQAKLHCIDYKSLPCTLPSYPLGFDVMKDFLNERKEEQKLADDVCPQEFEDWLQSNLDTKYAGIIPTFHQIETIDHSSSSSSSSSLEIPHGILHGDLFPDNAMFAEDGALVGIIDFEEICLGPLALDVAMTIIGCAYPSDNQLNLALAHAFLNGYQSVRPLTQQEKTLLPEFLSFAALSIAFWRYRQFNIRHPHLGRRDFYQIMFQRALTIPPSLFDS